MNSVILSGNVANIYINNNNVKMVLADRYKDKTSFIPITCFGNTAEFVQRYFKIGDHVAIQGRLGMYKDSCNRETIDVIADRVSFEGYRKPQQNTSIGMANNFIQSQEPIKSFVEITEEPSILNDLIGDQ